MSGGFAAISLARLLQVDGALHVEALAPDELGQPARKPGSSSTINARDVATAVNGGLPGWFGRSSR